MFEELLQIENELAETTVAVLRSERAADHQTRGSLGPERASQSELVAYLRSTVKNQEALIRAQHSEIAELYASTSWAITRPMRSLSALLRRRHR